ncbi:MAG: hypothetical protein KDK97_02810 [Verrucomicrobiales bacterium]|nr:hypothetical protein [Verrucomicrobiales bacterium]MCP5560419.1 hypothetical protein [Verrucomicrobiaceae bacterium]
MKIIHRSTSLLLLVVPTLLLSSCETMSISNTGRNPFYRGELRDIDLLGFPAGRSVSDDAIRSALARSSGGGVRLTTGDAVMLIQSGAQQPDPALTAAFEKHLRVSPFSGVPEQDRGTTQRFEPSALRYAAARAGAKKIVCVWGQLESANDSVGLDAVTWVPIVGEFIPGRRTVTRISLKGIVMDTVSGAWQSFASQPFVSSKMTAGITRELSTAKNIESLKSQAYADLVSRMLR